MNLFFLASLIAITFALNCYTCKKTVILINGESTNMAESPDDQVICSENFTAVCPIGTTECLHGNAKFEMLGMTVDMVYFKECGNEFSCELFQTLSQSNDLEIPINMKECNIKFCEGDLCNNATTEEVEAYSHGDTCFACSLLYAAMTYVWVFVY